MMQYSMHISKMYDVIIKIISTKIIESYGKICKHCKHWETKPKFKFRKFKKENYLQLPTYLATDIKKSGQIEIIWQNIKNLQQREKNP